MIADIDEAEAVWSGKDLPHDFKMPDLVRSKLQREWHLLRANEHQIGEFWMNRQRDIRPQLGTVESNIPPQTAYVGDLDPGGRVGASRAFEEHL